MHKCTSVCVWERVDWCTSVQLFVPFFFFSFFCTLLMFVLALWRVHQLHAMLLWAKKQKGWVGDTLQTVMKVTAQGYQMMNLKHTSFGSKLVLWSTNECVNPELSIHTRSSFYSCKASTIHKIVIMYVYIRSYTTTTYISLSAESNCTTSLYAPINQLFVFLVPKLHAFMLRWFSSSQCYQ